MAGEAHELRTPLNAIIGFSEALGERYFGDLNAKQDEYVKGHPEGENRGPLPDGARECRRYPTLYMGLAGSRATP